jgi:hypothetical protein
MSLTITSAYIAIVGEDHTIILPDDIPVGSRVSITVIPLSTQQPEDELRRTRFSDTLKAAQSATDAPATPSLNDEELDALVKRARRSA